MCSVLRSHTEGDTPGDGGGGVPENRQGMNLRVHNVNGNGSECEPNKPTGRIEEDRRVCRWSTKFSGRYLEDKWEGFRG
jgi:hypothetical protein